MQTNKLSFREALLNPGALSVTWELIPGRGAFEKSQEHVVKMAELAVKSKRINSITITDNPGGKPATLASAMTVEVKKLGIDPIIHFTCKDKNRNGIQSELYMLERAGLHNLLVLTGDYPVEGYTGRPKPVFDIDSVQALRLIDCMNKGEDVPGGKGHINLKATNFFAGAVVSPFKRTEAEQISQYYKLHKKIDSGAKFIITQLGYDAGKFDELRRYMNINNLNVPLIGNIFVLPLAAARLMNQNKVPGCVVTDEMLKVLEDEKSSCGNIKERQLLRAAKLYAVLKGLKYDGVNISGHGLKYEDVEFIIEKGEELSQSWQEIVKEFRFPVKDGFYYFKRDDSTALNTDEPVDRKKTGQKRFSLSFNIFNLIHRLFFDKKSPFFSAVRAVSKAVDKSFLKKPFTCVEYAVKLCTNDCRFCGDCAMVKLAYICPMSKCAKQQRNGPCGGSSNGWCEVYPGERKCLYEIAYSRLKTKSKEKELKETYIPPCNWELYQTCSWLNYFNGRDFQKING